MKTAHDPRLEPLVRAGLTPREAQVYDAFSSGEALNISQISVRAKLHRPGVYECLPRLLEAGLVRLAPTGKRAAYRTTGPKALEAWRVSCQASFGTYVGGLERTAGVQVASDDVQEYSGKDLGKVWQALADHAPRGSVFCRYDGYAPDVSVRTYVPEGYYPTIDRKKVERFVITNAGLRKANYKKRIECASRMMPGAFDAFEQGVIQFIVGDLLAFVDLKNEKAFVIKNKAIAAYNGKVFQFLFRALAE